MFQIKKKKKNKPSVAFLNYTHFHFYLVLIARACKFDVAEHRHVLEILNIYTNDKSTILDDV